MAWYQNLFFNLVKYPTRWLVKTSNIPTDIEGELGIDKTRPIIYLLKTNSVTDRVALELSTKMLGLPAPDQHLEIAGDKISNCLFLQEPESLLSKKSKHTDINKSFTRLFELHRDDENLDLQIVPVSIFWGRAPGKESRGWADLFTFKASPNWLRKFFIVLFLGRDNFVYYSSAVSSQKMATTVGSDSEIAHKLIRLARTHFYRRQQSMNGPMLMDRHQLFNSILAAPSVKKAMAQEAKNSPQQLHKARIKAKSYIEEIAADYREGVIRLGDRLLGRVWNKIYNGIEVKNADKVRELAQNGHEIIYVPCHRSHMDYLLLTYVIYHEGLVTPHIAAGINLNFWPIGGLFRRGGAFFIRRSFAGNKLYTAVFREYLEQLFNKGYSVKFYAEGGRSRTGRLLPPKTGMLAMTIQAMVKGVKRPVSIVPVYIGYEHVMEVKSYLKELRGKSKEKESFLGVFSAIRKLKNYGYGFLNFGEPIHLGQYLDKNAPDWREAQASLDDKKPSWLNPTVNTLSHNILERINQASAVSGMGLASLCLLVAEKRAMSKEELLQVMESYLALLRQCPFSNQSSFPQVGAEKLLENTLRLGKFNVTEDSFGEIISIERDNAILLTYYRNNILHMFCVPGLIAAIVVAHNECHREEVIKIVARIFPLLKKELFIYMKEEEAEVYTRGLIDGMVQQGMLKANGDILTPADTSSVQFYSLWLLKSVIQETLQRYALVLNQLEQLGTTARGALEKRSRQVAERMSTLHGISAPEFYDKNVLATFIAAAREYEIWEANEEGLLLHSEKSRELQQLLFTLVSPEFVKRLQQIK